MVFLQTPLPGLCRLVIIIATLLWPADPELSGSRVLAHDTLDSLLVLDSVSLEEVVGLSLSRRLRVRVVEEVLDAEENLLHRDGGLPRLFFVEDRQAHGARGVDVRVEQRGNELACGGSVTVIHRLKTGSRGGNLHFGGFVGYSEGRCQPIKSQ